MSNQKPKIKKPLVSPEAVIRAEMEMLKIYVSKYPQKAKEYLKEISFKIAQTNNLS